MKKQSRSEAREAVFTQVFQFSTQRENMDDARAILLEEIPECEQNLGYITTVTEGILEHEQEIIDIINAHCKEGWSFKRLSKATRTILKVAIYEMKYCDDVPAKVAINEAIELAKKIGCRYHFCHMSTKESFEAIRKARSEGYTNITCEVTPHHLVLNEEMIKDGNYKMNPPLRSEENRLATIEALIDGTAQMIACDHAPHTEEEKKREYNKCPNGIIGLETMVPIIYTEFVKNGKISLNRFLDLMVYNPISVFHLPKRDLKKGYIADLAILDIENPHTYTKDEILSKGKNSPFIGKTYYGFPKYTFVNGKLVYKR